MTHEVDYGTIKDEFTRRVTALNDMKKWLGPNAYKKVSQAALAMKNEPDARRQIAIGMELFNGISGYPVGVWLDFLGIPHKTPNNPVPQAQTQAQPPEKG